MSLVPLAIKIGISSVIADSNTRYQGGKQDEVLFPRARALYHLDPRHFWIPVVSILHVETRNRLFRKLCHNE